MVAEWIIDRLSESIAAQLRVMPGFSDPGLAQHIRHFGHGHRYPIRGSSSRLQLKDLDG